MSESLVEKSFYALLTVLAVAGILNGVLGVVEHAQNWPVFNAWVARVVGA